MSSLNISIPSFRVITWMNVIRKYKNEEQYRILENFWESQVKSKIWIINTLQELNLINLENAYVFGGWYGLMATLLVDNCNYNTVYSVDSDSTCKTIGEELDSYASTTSGIRFLTSNMEDFIPKTVPSIIINTSTEHLTDYTFDKWLSNMPNNTPIVLQGNNLHIEEHIRCSNNLEHFKQQNKLGSILWEGELDCNTFTRYMIVGMKNEITSIR